MTTEFYRYPIGLEVHLDTPTSPVYRIVQRRSRGRDVFGNCAEYCLEAKDGLQIWASEADLVPLDAWL